MKDLKLKTKRYLRRKQSVRAKITGTAARPRLCVFRSNTHIYGQIIDDVAAKTLVSLSDLNLKMGTDGPERGRRKKMEVALRVGEELAKKAIAKKIKTVVFDRNGFSYHGRVKALADGARKGGLT